MSSHVNKLIQFEHDLRHHVQQERDRLEEDFECVTKTPYTGFEIRFNTADGGQWSVSAWCSIVGGTIETKAAALRDAREEFMRQVHVRMKVKTLPSLLTYDDADDDDDA